MSADVQKANYGETSVSLFNENTDNFKFRDL